MQRARRREYCRTIDAGGVRPGCDCIVVVSKASTDAEFDASRRRHPHGSDGSQLKSSTLCVGDKAHILSQGYTIVLSEITLNWKLWNGTHN